MNLLVKYYFRKVQLKGAFVFRCSDPGPDPKFIETRIWIHIKAFSKTRSELSLILDLQSWFVVFLLFLLWYGPHTRVWNG